MKKIVLLNAKGGAGKTTIAVNLAGYYAHRGRATTLLDYDKQGSSSRWVEARPKDLPVINLVKGYESSQMVTRSWAMRIPPQTEYLIVDTPARIERDQLQDWTRDASAVIVPVLPSGIDIHAASRCIADLLLIAKIGLHEGRIAVVANRARERTRAYQALRRFLASLDIPYVTTLRDTQNYVRAASEGMAIHEMKSYRTGKDKAQWQLLIDWLDQRQSTSHIQPATAAVSAR